MGLDRYGRLRKFLLVAWHTTFRYPDRDSAEIRDGARKLRVYDETRRFLLDVIHRDAMTPEEWSKLFKVDVADQDAVRADAEGLWAWLYDGEEVPPAGSTEEDAGGG